MVRINPCQHLLVGTWHGYYCMDIPKYQIFLCRIKRKYYRIIWTCTLRKILRARLDAYIQNKKILDCQGAQLNKRTASRCFCINNLQGIKSNKTLEYWTYQNFLWSKQKICAYGLWHVLSLHLIFKEVIIYLQFMKMTLYFG